MNILDESGETLVGYSVARCKPNRPFISKPIAASLLHCLTSILETLYQL